MVDLLALDENEKAAALKALSEEIDDENGGCGWHRFGEFFDAFPEEMVDDVLPRHFFRRNGHGETVGELLLEGGLLRGLLRPYMLDPPAEIFRPERLRLVGVFDGSSLGVRGELRFPVGALLDGRTAEAAFDGGCVRSPVPELLYDKRILSFRRSGTPPVAVGLALRGLLPEEKTREIALAPKYTVRGEPFAFFLARVGRLGGDESFLRRKAARGELTLSRSDRERLDAVLSTRDARANARRKAYCGEGPLLAEDFASEFEAVLDALSFARLPDGALSTEAALLRMRPRDGLSWNAPGAMSSGGVRSETCGGRTHARAACESWTRKPNGASTRGSQTSTRSRTSCVPRTSSTPSYVRTRGRESTLFSLCSGIPGRDSDTIHSAPSKCTSPRRRGFSTSGATERTCGRESNSGAGRATGSRRGWSAGKSRKRCSRRSGRGAAKRATKLARMPLRAIFLRSDGPRPPGAGGPRRTKRKGGWGDHSLPLLPVSPSPSPLLSSFSRVFSREPDISATRSLRRDSSEPIPRAHEHGPHCPHARNTCLNAVFIGLARVARVKRHTGKNLQKGSFCGFRAKRSPPEPVSDGVSSQPVQACYPYKNKSSNMKVRKKNAGRAAAKHTALPSPPFLLSGDAFPPGGTRTPAGTSRHPTRR